MVVPRRAAVVPRVLSEISGEPFPLEEMVAPYLGRTGAIAVLGPVGSGKTTAIQHLAAVFPGRLVLVDDMGGHTLARKEARSHLVVYACDRIHDVPHLATMVLAPWGLDEALDYMMAVHPDACARVLPLVVADPDMGSLGGIAELWCAVLDRMAEGATGVATALVEIASRTWMGDRFYRHRVVRTFRRARELALEIAGGPGEWPMLLASLERDVIHEAAKVLKGNGKAREALERFCDEEVDFRQPMAASLLLAIDPEWRPSGVPWLEGAYLGGARWRAADLRDVILVGADLTGANLDAAALDGADASLACFRRASLRGTSFRRAYLARADLGGADLAGARLDGATLSGANLREARLMGAGLSGASLVDTSVEGADLSGANLSGAQCRGLDLRKAVLDGANFSAALLQGCHLDGVYLRAARFDHAQLADAFLTASVMPRACFRDANLAKARLADVAWEGADLRGADFRDANFHMGSSRSGLVDSFLASEGTRTGFYTDDFDEQHFKAPEEIRKANLRGADLRGARVFDTDFYLVDLRNALYDGKQETHFRRCKAILGSGR
jgi:uncharacterized protein YjbI with pentapeptide repeats